jgi:hypothetical protein
MGEIPSQPCLGGVAGLQFISAINHQQQERKNTVRNKIINYIRAGYPGLYLVSAEEQRVEAEMNQVAQDLNYNLSRWKIAERKQINATPVCVGLNSTQLLN